MQFALQTILLMSSFQGILTKSFSSFESLEQAAEEAVKADGFVVIRKSTEYSSERVMLGVACAVTSVESPQVVAKVLPKVVVYSMPGSEGKQQPVRTSSQRIIILSIIMHSIRPRPR